MEGLVGIATDMYLPPPPPEREKKKRMGGGGRRRKKDRGVELS